LLTHSLILYFVYLFRMYYRYQQLMLVIVLYLNMVPPVDGVNPNVQKDYDDLPAMGKNIWDGIPTPMFIISFFEPLLNAIGSVSENGATLLMTYHGIDPGGSQPGANPHFAVANGVVRQQNANRIRRLFACVMNYILASSFVYRYLMRNFRNDGIAAMNYIRNFGNIQFPPAQLKRMQNTWEEMTLRTLTKHLKKPLNPSSLFQLTEWIIENGRYLSKSNDDMKEKFLDALITPQMQHIISREKSNGTHIGYAYPANYPPWFPAHLALNAHPHANECDLYRLAKCHTAEWVDLLVNGKIKDDSRGVLEINEINDESGSIISDHGATTNMIAPIKFSRVLPSTKCIICHGVGHGGETIMEDGSCITCATKLLGIKPDTSSDKKSFDKGKYKNKYKQHYKQRYQSKFRDTRKDTRDTRQVGTPTRSQKRIAKVESDISDSSASHWDEDDESTSESLSDEHEISQVGASTSRLQIGSRR
jgi:hypothetical protein